MTDTIDQIVARDHSTPPPPDLGAVRAAGRRIRARRRTTLGLAVTAVTAVAAAVAVPVLVGTGSQSTTGLEVGAPVIRSATAATWRPSPGCAIFACTLYEPLTPPAGTVLGTPWDIGLEVAGGTETYWVERVQGSDLDTGNPATVRVLEFGITRDGALQTMARPTQLDRPDKPIQFVSLREDDGSYRVLGYFEGAHDQVFVEGPEVERRPVRAVSTTMLPGYTFFVDTGVQVDVADPGYDPEGLVFSTPDGTSCRVESCAAPGGGF